LGDLGIGIALDIGDWAALVLSGQRWAAMWIEGTLLLI